MRLRCLQEMLFFRQPEYYVSGEILHHYEVWDHILTGYRKREEILRYVSEGVSVYDICFGNLSFKVDDYLRKKLVNRP